MWVLLWVKRGGGLRGAWTLLCCRHKRSKRESIREFKGRRVSLLLGRHPGICGGYWCGALSRNNPPLHPPPPPSLFPFVLLKLNGLCFKNSALSKPPLKLLSPFFFFFLCSSSVLLINIMCLFWLKRRCRSLKRGTGLEVIPERGWERKRCWLAFLRRCGAEIVDWSQILFRDALCAFPTSFAARDALDDTGGRRFFQAALRRTLLRGSTCDLHT